MLTRMYGQVSKLLVDARFNPLISRPLSGVNLVRG